MLGCLGLCRLEFRSTRREGRRFVEEAGFVKGDDAKENSWDIGRLERVLATN